jgi:hypothetical protein
MRLKHIFVIVFIMTFSIECNTAKKPDPKDLKSSKTVEDFSGITTVKQGEYLKGKIKELEQKQEARAKEAEQTE